MQPEQVLFIANNSFGYWRDWPPSPFAVGGLTWDRQDGVFRTTLPSGQRLEVSFDSTRSVLARHCRVGVKLDELFLGWFKDTREIPAGTVRQRAEELIAFMTPVSKRVITRVDSTRKSDREAADKRAVAAAKETERQARIAREAALRRADGK
jgi:hypothetical protein